MKKLKTEFKFDDKARTLRVNEPVELSDVDIVNKYKEFVARNNQLLKNIEILKKEAGNIQDKILELLPYFNKVKDKVAEKMVFNKGKV